MTDQERKAALEALSTSYTNTDQTGYPDTVRLYMPREDYMTIRAALTPSQMDENVREAVEHFSVEIAAGKWDRDDGREFLETLICAATAQKFEWQPIETAPRDALVFNGQDWFSGYRKDNGVWLALDPAGGGSCVISPTPIRWMPLPAAPVDKSAEVE